MSRSTALFLALLFASLDSALFAALPQDWKSLDQAQTAAGLSAKGASAGSLTSAKSSADSAIDGGIVVDGSPQGRASLRSRLAASSDRQRKVEVPAVESTAADGGGAMMPKPPKWAVYGGSAALGAISAGLTGGLFAAFGGAIVGLGAAYLFEKGDYGAAFGMTLGGVIGSFMGGPLGGLIGAVVGGLLGHFIGKLFLKKSPAQSDSTD